MTELRGGVLVRSYLLIGAGLPVCVAIVVFALGFTGYELLATDPFAPRSDLLQTWLFALPAGVVLFICLRAYRRVRSSGESGPLVFLARLVPILALVGLAGGILFTRSLIADALHNQLESEKALCDEVLTHKEGARDWIGVADEKLVSACVPHAHRCEKERKQAQAKDGWNLHPDRDQRPEVICLRKAGRAAGWLQP